MAKKDETKETAYSDVSKELEESNELAKQPPEFDDEGKLKPVDSEASRTVSEEQMVRAAGAANGGGPWPQDLLREIGTTQSRTDRDLPAYTSHEVKHG